MAQDAGFHTTHNYVVTIVEFPGIKFATLSGGESNIEGTKVWPGGNENSRNVDGPASVSDITITKPSDPFVDAPLKAWHAAWRNGGVRRKITVVKQQVLPSGVPVPGVGPTIYTGCSPRTYTTPPVERGTANAAMLSFVLSPEAMQE